MGLCGDHLRLPLVELLPDNLAHLKKVLIQLRLDPGLNNRHIKGETMIKVAVNGAAGRMGGRLITAIKETEGLQLTGALEHAKKAPCLDRIAGLTCRLRSIERSYQQRP